MVGTNPWESKFYRDKLRRLQQWLAILALTIAATVLNPSGIQGAVYPLTIWNNYGIAVIENLSVPFLDSRHYTGDYTLIKLTILALGLSFILSWRRAARFPVALFILAAVIAEMTWTAIRHQTLLAFFSLPLIAINAQLPRKKLVFATIGLIMLAGAFYNGRELLTRKDRIGLNLKPGIDAGAKFLAAANVPAPCSPTSPPSSS